jgi:two-component system sensor histidine kinase/response regulator
MYGVEKEEFVGASMKAFTQEVARGEAQIAEILQVGACQSFESVHLTRKGRKVNVLVSSSVIKYRGQQAILSFIREITERKQTEEALAEKKNALELSSKTRPWESIAQRLTDVSLWRIQRL